MLSKKITLSLLSLALIAPFAQAATSQSESTPAQMITIEQPQAILAQNMPQQTRWETFVYKVAPLGVYIVPASASVGAAAATVALGLSLRDKASLKHAAITAATAGVAGFALSINCLFWTHFGITESLD